MRCLWPGEPAWWTSARYAGAVIMDNFTDKAQNDDFRKWMRDNPRGYYLNRRGRASMMLHRVGCSHLGNAERLNLSNNPKVASNDKSELEVWLRTQGQFVERCATCRP